MFETTDPAEVESVCAALGMELRWTAGGGFEGQLTRPGVERDAADRPVWLNHAHTFVPSPAAVGRISYGIYRALQALPPFRQGAATFGDGGPIPLAMVEEISSVIVAESHLVDWARHDLLVIDNQRVLHGRMPYTGARRVWAAMGPAGSRSPGRSGG